MAAAATNGNRHMIRESTNEIPTMPMLPFNNFNARLMYGPAFIRGISLKRISPVGSNPSFGNSGSPSTEIGPPGSTGAPSRGSLGSASNGTAPAGIFGRDSPTGVPFGRSGRLGGRGFLSGMTAPLYHGRQ